MTLLLTSFLEVGKAVESRRVVCLIQARLYQMIVRSVFTVSCPVCGAPVALTRRWPRRATNPVQICWKSYVSFLLSWERWPSLIRQNCSRGWSLDLYQDFDICELCKPESIMQRLVCNCLVTATPRSRCSKQKRPSVSNTLSFGIPSPFNNLFERKTLFPVFLVV